MLKHYSIYYRYANNGGRLDSMTYDTIEQAMNKAIQFSQTTYRGERRVTYFLILDSEGVVVKKEEPFGESNQ